jgi:hypothetical protein
MYDADTSGQRHYKESDFNLGFLDTVKPALNGQFIKRNLS